MYNIHLTTKLIYRIGQVIHNLQKTNRLIIMESEILDLIKKSDKALSAKDLESLSTFKLECIRMSLFRLVKKGLIKLVSKTGKWKFYKAIEASEHSNGLNKEIVELLGFLNNEFFGKNFKIIAQHEEMKAIIRENGSKFSRIAEVLNQVKKGE